MLTERYGHADFVERLAVLEDNDDISSTDRYTAQIVASFDYLIVSGTEGDPNKVASVMREAGMVDSAAIVSQLAPISFLDRDHRALRNCPRCGEDCSTTSITKTAYTFESCDCDASTATHSHLVEQLWHRTCISQS